MTYQVNKICAFNKVKFAGWSLYINKYFPSLNIEPFLEAGDLNGVRGPFEPIAASRFARVFKCSASFKGLRNDLYFKQFLYRSPLDFIKHIFRPGRAARSRKASVMLEDCGLLSPEIVAMGQRKIGTIVIKSFLLTRSVENSASLYEYVHGDKLNPSDRKTFITQLGTVIGRMHSAGIFHGDLRPGNILIKESQGSFAFYFLDNERTRRFKVLPEKLRIKNLVQINMFRINELCATDRMRFYKSYLTENTGEIDTPKELAKIVAEKTTRRLKSKPI